MDTGSCVFNSSIRSRKEAQIAPARGGFCDRLGHACCEEDPRARPTAALCLAKCREFLGETWTANDIMWGSMQPTERVAYWTTEMMDVGIEESGAERGRGREGLSKRSGNGGTPTTNGRTKTHGKGGMRRRESDDDDDDDDDDDNNNNNNNNNNNKGWG